LIGLAGCSLKVGDGGCCTLRLQSVLSKSNSLVFKFDFEFELDREFNMKSSWSAWKTKMEILRM